MKREQLSVIVPTLNEEGNVAELIRRFDASFREADIEYEVIIVDDHSKDGTKSEVEKLSKTYPVFFHSKKGERGKAYSILEGFEYARFETIAMIDADLQYPPEALPEMFEKLHSGFDIIVANRIDRETSFLRRVLSRGFALVFSKFLHGLDCDVQSGMKVFRTRIAREVNIKPDPWTFDLEFLLTARDYGYVIGGHEIFFAERKSGESKIVFWKAIREIGWNAIQLRFRSRLPLHVHPEETRTKSKNSMIGAGVAHGRTRFVTHSTLSHHVSALHTFLSWQKWTMFVMGLVFLVGMIFWPMPTLIVLTAFLSALYFFDVFFNLFFVARSLKNPPELSFSDQELSAIRDENLPIYSILCPLYREAHILPNFLEAIQKLDWPKEKLDVLLLLEENDPETVEAACHMDIPSFVRIVVVPHSEPKTKPKACNYGLSMAIGEYVVIYDAEDIPDPLQLKKAYLGFQTLPREVWCLQAKLNYFNANQNILTRLFTAEYSLWFDVTLPGLQSVATSIPLGGTSNHFRREDLLELEGWDPFNVTEDCDLGARIFTRGYRTAIIDSVTLEEANSKIGNWIRQRSRWIKGYMQTYLVHMRHPIAFFRQNGIHAVLFQFIVGGKIAFMLINPLLWLQTILYFTFRSKLGPTIEAFYPNIVFYMAVISLIFGNFLAMYYYMIGCAKREKWDLMKWVFLIPFYWLLVSVAAVMAMYQLFAMPHYWEKTVHGFHLKKKRKYVDLFRREKSKNKPEAGEKKDEKSGVSEMFPWNHVFAFRKKAVSSVHDFFSNLVVSVSRIFFSISRLAQKIFLRENMNRVTRFLFSSEGIFLCALFLANVINFLFNVFLGRVLSLQYFGLVIFINSIWSFAGIFISAYGTLVNHETAFLFSKGNKKTKTWLPSILRKSSIFLLCVSFVWVWLVPEFSRFFSVDIVALYLFTPAFLFGIIGTVSRGYVQGMFWFYIAAAAVLFEPVSKFIIAIAIVSMGYPELAYLSIPYSIVISSLLSLFIVRKEIASLFSRSFREASEQLSKNFYFAIVAGSIGSLLFLNIDIFLVKHYFDPVVAGEYAILALIGKMVFFLGTLPLSLLVTLVSRAEGNKKDSRKVFYALYFPTVAFVFFAVFGLFLFGDSLVPFIFGESSKSILSFLPIYATAFGFFTLMNVVVTYHLVRKQYAFSVIPILSAVSMAFLVIMRHENLWEVSMGVFLSSFLWWIAIQIFDVFENRFTFVYRSMFDFLGVFKKVPFSNVREYSGLRILIFNWRDKRHVFSGGAEEYVHEMAKEWVKSGHQVTLFCGNDGKSLRNETVHGIRIIRRGGFYLVYVWAFFYYAFQLRHQCDVIIDCENGIPFFTPLYVRKPVFCLMHHVHQSVFFRYLSPFFAKIASFLEKDLMPIVYKNVRFITVSESSRREMKEMGIGVAGIDIVHPGVRLEKFHDTKTEKNQKPQILYLGRLKSYKSIDVLIRAFSKVLSRVPDARLIIAGSGEERKNLERLAGELGLSQDVTVFLGHVSEAEKIDLFRGSWVVVNPSYMEGWGIVVIEANACGTPIVASDVPGLRDSVKHGETGFLVPFGDADAFANKISEILLHEDVRIRMERDARIWSENFSWESGAAEFFRIISSGLVTKNDTSLMSELSPVIFSAEAPVRVEKEDS